MVQVVLPRTTGGAGAAVNFPRASDYAEIPITVVGPVPEGVLAQPIITRPITGLTGQARGSGTGQVQFQSNGSVVATASFPSGSVSITGQSLSGVVTITSSGSLSDVSVTIGGLR